jgi:hypothetical protein
MPDVVREATFKGHPGLEFYNGEYNGEPQFFFLGIKKLTVIDDNIDTVRKFLDKNNKGGKR